MRHHQVLGWIDSVFLVLGLVIASQIHASERQELELTDWIFGEREFELSGMVMFRDSTLIVSDNNKDSTISEIRVHRGRFLIESRIDLTKLRGFSEFQADALAKAKALGHDRWLDLEGIATCGDIIYLANERIRQVARVDKQSIQGLNIDWSAVPQIMQGEANAGFEGVAVDCDGQRLWIAKEREPRGIVTVDLKEMKAVSWNDFIGSDRQGQKVIEFKAGRGLMELSPDIGDIQFLDGYLYVLERNTYEIAKVDPKTWEVTARVSYYQSAVGMYDSGEPFGLAEGLLVDRNSISVGMDNNGAPISSRAVEKFRVSGPLPGILKFKRPENPKF